MRCSGFVWLCQAEAVGNPSDPSTLPAWQRLQELAATVGQQTVAQLMDEREAPLTAQVAGVTLDYSRQRVNAEVMQALFALAEATGVAEQREAMFTGSHVNTTEDRAALHTALRAAAGAQAEAGDAQAAAQSVLAAMGRFADGVRNESITGATGRGFRTVINIGIGGSDLGPAMAYQALRPFRDPRISVRFVSNIDPDDLQEALTDADPASTLFLIASKTFTTAETMANAQAARAWLVAALGEDAVQDHFAALSTAVAEVEAFGIAPDHTFGFWDWVGGRYSLGSAIGLSLMIAIGPHAFTIMLDGFRTVDEGFRYTPPHANVPLIMGLLGVWNRTFLDIPTVAVLPYAHRLRRFPAYLQQLTMESNGKSVRHDVTPVSYPTGPVYWGEAGTNGQHSFHQLLHQGTDSVACDIIVIATSAGDNIQQQHALVAHALAQASVLAGGRSLEDILHQGVPEEVAAHRVMPGTRPTSVVIARELDPFTLGALIAIYEHAVFVEAAVWGINAFDQWGVELGKQVATDIIDAWKGSAPPGIDRHTASTMAIVREYADG
jgi:glucose-6-phosphate isomerase